MTGESQDKTIKSAFTELSKAILQW